MFIFNLIGGVIGLYSLLIIIRIILTWFPGPALDTKPVLALAKATDPYLDWWRKSVNLKAGILDLSPIVGLSALSLVQFFCNFIAVQGRITLGIFLAATVSSVWSIASFVFGFCFVAIVLRIIAHVTNNNNSGTFWKIVDSISSPIISRVKRIIFGNKFVSYMKGIVASAAVTGAAWVAGKILVSIIVHILKKLPF
jgi:YggT family protein